MDSDQRALYFAFFNEIGIISQLGRALMDARLPAGLSIAHFSVLNHLIRVRDGGTPLDIARAFQVPKTTMTHTLSGLEKRGLIEMRPNPDDGRSKCVWLTAAGRSFRDETIISLAPDVEWFTSAIPPDRVAEMVSHLAEVRKLLDDNRPENESPAGGNL